MQSPNNRTTNWLDATRTGNTAHVDHVNVFYQIPVNDNGTPIVYLHGYEQSRMSWITTPDGREGWSDLFRKKDIWRFWSTSHLVEESVNYTELLKTADVEYDTYKYQRDRDKRDNPENETLLLDRIEMLQKSLDKREEAHKECENPLNERLLANGYRDMGDEYFSREMQSDAIVAYEKSAEWYMKAIYHAAAKKDYDEMKSCMELFEKLGNEAEKLNEIDLDRKEKIQKMIEVYNLFTDKINR